MISETPEMLYAIALEEKELKLLTIASIQTLKREVFNLVRDSLDGVIKKEVFNNILDILVQKETKLEIGNACPFLKKLCKIVTY